MMALVLRLLPVWRWLRSNPLLALCVILALWGSWERSGRMKALDQRDRCRAASADAAAQTKALREEERAKYQEQARETDARYAASLAGARSDTARFVAARRLRPHDLSAAEPISEASSSELPAPVPSEAVVVDATDLHACADLYTYATSARDWALTITENPK